MIHQHTLRTATKALSRNIMRAALTTLGIVIGISAVITMVEIGRGSSTAVQDTIASMGANTLLVLPGQATSGGVSWGAGSAMTLTPQDCDAILNPENCPAVEAATPIVTVRAQVTYGNQNWVPMNITGSTPAFLQVRNWTLAEGQCFTNRDVRNYSKVCLLGHTIVQQLFQDEDPIGKEIRIRSVSFKVVGVLRQKGANMMGWDQDDIIIAPWTAIKYRVAGVGSTMSNASAAGSASAVNSIDNIFPLLGANEALYYTPTANEIADESPNIRFTTVNQILVSARSGTAIPQAIRQITALLHERHRIKPDKPDDFQIRDMTEMITALTSVTGLMGKLLLCVAAISLVVGGVGIMNIMLVSVTERTREIGLRMAVGARPRDILSQFLIEAVVLCSCGGVIGIALGKTGSYLVTRFLRWPTEGSALIVIVAVLVSAGVGICFGFYPAWKASRLDPIDALRYE